MRSSDSSVGGGTGRLCREHWRDGIDGERGTPCAYTAGNYDVAVMWTNPPIDATFGMTLKADHEVSSSSGLEGHWSIATRRSRSSGTRSRSKVRKHRSVSSGL